MKYIKIIGRFLFSLRFFGEVSISIFKIYIHLKINNNKCISYEDVNQKMKSDTLFILGSGASINQYSQPQWNDITRGDSIGLNNWIIHPFYPTYYFFELPKEKSDIDIFLTNLELTMKNNRISEYVYRFTSDSKSKHHFLSDDKYFNIKYLLCAPLAISSLDRLDIGMILMRSLLPLFKRINRFIVFSKRASLFSAIVFGYMANYRKIVLCGIDLNSTDYFFDDSPEKFTKNGFIIPNKNQNSIIHRTNDPSIGKTTVSELIRSLDRLILKPAGVNLYVGSITSELYNILPCYWENE